MNEFEWKDATATTGSTISDEIALIGAGVGGGFTKKKNNNCM